MKTFKELFVPYEQELILKELGIDCECVAYWICSTIHTLVNNNPITNSAFEEIDLDYVTSCTFDQVFEFFREKYDLCAWIQPAWYNPKTKIQHYSVNIMKPEQGEFKEYGMGGMLDVLPAFEEAQKQAIIRLIEIVQDEK